VSVRKAFLDLDTDYDGYVTVDDILRFFGGEDKELDFKDLTKLIIDKDNKKQGKINYTDFSKWVGGEIQKSEGFYFRHDSQRNP
jgi:Ca2+-binding EF-hand superfamily protein